MKLGNSRKNAIIIDAKDYMTGMIEEHRQLNTIYKNLNVEIESIEQELILEKGKKYDLFTITMNGGAKKKIYFDITNIFFKI